MSLTLDHASRPGHLGGSADLQQALAEFTRLRPRLLAIAHRILASWSDAEDVAQDAWLRWQACDRAAVRHPTAFLVTTTTRLALNVAQSARVRRESSLADPMPDIADPNADPATDVDRLAALEHEMHLLQRLGSTERAAFVLRHAFGYPYARIAELARTSEVNARQIVSRAGKHMADGRRPPVAHAAPAELVGAFDIAARLGGLSTLERVLTTDT